MIKILDVPKLVFVEIFGRKSVWTEPWYLKNVILSEMSHPFLLYSHTAPKIGQIFYVFMSVKHRKRKQFWEAVSMILKNPPS